jgi:hypothetical protein
MSGIEGVALAGGRLLGPLAAKAASSLARKVTFRWRVSRRVRKRIDFSCSWRAYRGWLKALTPEELSAPVEDVAGRLAVQLDDRLSGASDKWRSAHDHLSRALRLVELTYPAIAAALDEGDRVELSEAWTQQRSAQVRELLLQVAGPGAALSSGDLAAALLQRSMARRAVRLQAFNLDEAALRPYFDRIACPDVPKGQVVVLLGDFGAGKSEMAESWHRAAIRKLEETVLAPLPVWLRAWDLATQTIEDAVDRQVGATWRHGRGASIVVDGLDEAAVVTAQAILDGARILSRSHVGVQILVTARPGVLSATDHEREKVDAPLLPVEEALELVELAAGEPHATWQWTAGMRTTVRRPFFALTAGSMLGREQAPRSEADLIRTLVENSLASGAERSAVTSVQTRSVLTTLAVSLTRSGKDQLSYSDRQVARSSRLIADGPRSEVLFSLPIFQHWFAAQAILDGSVSPMDVVADAANFNRWRWAAAVAALSASTPEAVDELVGTWVQGNPGAAAWILKEAFSSRGAWRPENSGPIDPATAKTRLLKSLSIWVGALGPLAEGILQSPEGDGSVATEIAVWDHQFAVRMDARRPAPDDVAKAPSLAPLSAQDVRGWRSWFGGQVPDGDAWPWLVIRDRIAREMIGRLTNDPYLGTPDGIWRQERRFEVARHIVRPGTWSYDDLAADEVRAASTKLLDSATWNPRSRFTSSRGRTVRGAELLDLVGWIDSTEATQVSSHLPSADVAQPLSGWVWDFYSPERLMAFEAEVYGRACEAYEEALVHTFGQFDWSMPRSGIQPRGVILELSYHEDGIQGGQTPGLTIVPVPMPLMERLAPTGTGVVWSNNKRVVISQTAGEDNDWERHSSTVEVIVSWLAQQDREASALGWSHTIVDNMRNPRPSSWVAANWLWEDLKSLGLGNGNFPMP